MKIFLDDLREAPQGYVTARTYEECIELLKNNEVEVLSLDHDLGTDKTGYDVCLWLAENEYFIPEIYIHSANPVGQMNMTQLLNRYMPKETKFFVKFGDGFVPLYRQV